MTVLTFEQVRYRFRRRGLSKRQALIGAAIACCESPAKADDGGFASDFSRLGDLDLVDAKWGPSVGGLQIRSENAQRGTGGLRDQDWLIRVANNLDAAVTIFRSEGWEPWSTFTSGMYQALLPTMFPVPEGIYVVQPGDTLSEIALRIGGFPWQEWARINGLHDPYLLRIGDKLTMPV